MRILIINQAFHPDVVATAQHMTDWALELTAAGHQVTVVASRSAYGQLGATLPKRETWRGIAIYRVGFNVFGKRGIVARLADFATFHLLCLMRALILPRQDVVVCLTTPPFVGVVGRLVKLLRGSRYVQYEMDIYPDVAVALGAIKQRSMAHRFFEWLHRRLLKAADRVVVLGRDMQRLIGSKGVPDAKMVLVTPWADPDEIAPLPRDTNAFRLAQGLADRFVVMYSGNLGLGHDTTTICAAMAQLHAEGILEKAGGVSFVFIGGGKRMKEIREFCQSHNLPTPRMLDYQPREKLPETLSAADAHLITQAPGTTGLIVPSKLYGILAAGRPVLYIGPDDTEVALTVREANVGTVLAIGDGPGLVAAIRKYQSELANLPTLEAQARSVLTQEHSRQVCCAKLTAMVEGLVAGSARR